MDIVQESVDHNHAAFISAIENREFNKAKKILAIDSQNKYIRSVGALQITALHVAAWQGSIDLLNLLYKRGADVNDVDKIGRTALYYAAHEGNAEVTKWLVERGADVNAKVGVHSCARNNPYPSLMKLRDVGKKLPLPVCWGRTPLHQAVRNNHADIVRILIEGDANVDVQDDHNITPLLLAGNVMNRNKANEMAKFVEIIEILVFAKAAINSVHPSTGTTALHHAAMLGSAEATQILLANGAEPMYRCSSSGSTPLHIAANTGNCETLMTLLEAMPFDIDTPDQINRTALHIAAYQGHRECVRALISYGANLTATTNTGVTAVDAIFSHISRPLEFLKNILDSCVQPGNKYRSEKYENIVVDFKILAPKYNQMQMAVVTAIIAATSNITQLAILQHPLIETFLRLKWAKLRTLFFGFMFAHLLFVISLSIYAIMNVQHITTYIEVVQGCLIFFSCFILFNNIIQVTLEPKHYLRQFETWLSFVSATLALAASVTSDFAKSKHNNKSEFSMFWVLHFISLAILMSWMHMMLLIGRVPMCYPYALMFSTVLKNIVKVLLAFCCLIIGFAFSFSIVFHGQDEFNFWNSIMKTMVMMMGEYEYEKLFPSNNTTYNEKDKGIFLPFTGQIIFFVFIMIASIALVNLMIGLAVNDIQGLEREGRIRRLLKQAEFIAHLERVTSHRIFRCKWLFCLIMIPTKITLASRQSYHRISHLLEKPIPKIPADLIDALFLLANKPFFSNDNSADENIEINGRWLVSTLFNLEEQIQHLKAYSYRNSTNRKSMNRHRVRKKNIRKKQ
ncbi:transient receptor potential channel pyrexia-like isoform X1 [Linepithema humile]|uniref:transient receptor potential channel pyrexia-like isoform X1 n=2 Tax=Linepithema humile TaxID=83485 RepID=UPI0006237D24|nr:PREDICTED: transient receptor potential channel pyrexia-like isoform X2 [Linepithema humile]